MAPSQVSAPITSGNETSWIPSEGRLYAAPRSPGNASLCQEVGRFGPLTRHDEHPAPSLHAGGQGCWGRWRVADIVPAVERGALCRAQCSGIAGWRAVGSQGAELLRTLGRSSADRGRISNTPTTACGNGRRGSGGGPEPPLRCDLVSRLKFTV